LSKAKFNNPGEILRRQWPHSSLSTARDFPIVIQKALLDDIVSMTKWYRITEIEVRSGFNDGQVHVGVSGIWNYRLYFPYREVAFGVFDLAGFKVNNPVTFTLLRTRKVLLRKLISFRRDVVID
jgi:hypothetical protein